VALAGKADRVDIWTSPEGESFLRVVDYKTGTRKFSPEDIKNGYSLQMPLYLKTLCDRAYPLLNHELGLPTDTVLRPAGVTYLSSAVRSENTPAKQPKEDAMCDAVTRLSRSGVLLDEPAVLAAASHKADPAIVGSARSKKTLDAIGFEEMFRDLDDTITSLCTEMRAGNATARPNQYGDHDPCKYCGYAAVCRAAQTKQEGEDD
jgi:ATP-dependent helicase/nuclease subunit B